MGRGEHESHLAGKRRQFLEFCLVDEQFVVRIVKIAADVRYRRRCTVAVRVVLVVSSVTTGSIIATVTTITIPNVLIITGRLGGATGATGGRGWRHRVVKLHRQQRQPRKHAANQPTTVTITIHRRCFRENLCTATTTQQF